MTDKIKSDKRIPKGARMFWKDIVSLSQKNGYAFPSNAWISQEYGVDRSTSIRWIRILEKNDYIKTEYVQGNRRIYPIGGGGKNETGGGKNETGGWQKGNGGVAKMKRGGGKNATHIYNLSIVNNKSNSDCLNDDKAIELSERNRKVDEFMETNPEIKAIAEKAGMERAMVTMNGKKELAEKIYSSFYYSEASRIIQEKIKNLQE